MKNLQKFFTNILIFVFAGNIVASCFSDDEYETVLNNDLVLTGVSFGTLPRTMHTTSKSGKDSTFMSTVSATSVYPFTIDHINNLAYNLDSLPQGTRADKIIFSTFTVNNGTFTIKSLKTGEDTLYSVTDTLDFSRGPREFKLWGSDGTSRRNYRVEVRIHQQKQDSVTWRKYGIEDWPAVPVTFPENTNTFATSDYIFTLEDGKMLASFSGSELADDSIRTDELPFLPTANFSWTSGKARANKNSDEIILYGTRLEADTLVGNIWRRNIDRSGVVMSGWEFLPPTPENNNHVPGIHDASIFNYDKGLLLVGIRSNGLLSLKYSSDGGCTWKNHEALVLPNDLKEQKVNSLRTAIDEHSNIWLFIDDKDVWYGRAHAVSWAEDQRIFVN